MSTVTEYSPMAGMGATLIDAAGLARYIPEPQNRLGFGLSSIGSVVGGLASTLGGGSAPSGTISPEYRDLLERQIEIQTQMQLVSMESNIEKSRHETQMAAIRNIRVG